MLLLIIPTWANDAFQFVTTFTDPNDQSTYSVGIRKLYNVLCDTPDHGPVYGKLDEDGDAYYSFDEKVYECESFSLVEGEPIENKGSIPEECQEHRKTQKTGVDFFPVIVKSRHGLIPGKANSSELGYFAWKGTQLARKNFRWFC
jgi:hypothetical protein